MMITRSMKRKNLETRDYSQSTTYIKRKKKLKIDWLSKLPDDLILQILSYIDTKLAVQTCVLSKRWRNLWEYLPALNIYRESFCKAALFENFISQFLKNHKAGTVFSLSLRISLASSELSVIGRALEHVVSRHVQCVHLDSFIWNSTSNFASILLSCKSLTSLKLERCTLYVSPSCLNFPCLKILSLHNVIFICERNSPIEVFSRCTSLENLHIRWCLVKRGGDFIIRCPQLVNLKVSYTWFPPSQHRKIVVFAPKLTSFKFEEGILGLILSFENSPRLHAVDFHTVKDYSFQSRSQEWKEKYLTKLVNLFKSLRSAKSLSISMETIKVLSEFSNTLKNQICPFDHLENVKVLVAEEKIGVKVPFGVKQYLLSGSPNVKAIDVVKQLNY